MSKFVNLALDMGTSGWKVGHKSNLFYLLSLVSTSPPREKVNGIFEANYRDEGIDGIVINSEIGKFYVGNIARYAKAPYSGYGPERYAQRDFMLPMTLAAMSEAKLTGSDPVVITTAIPATWENAAILNGGNEIKIIDVIKDHFYRDHAIDREGQRGQRTVSVDEVRVLTETQALLYSFLLNKDGSAAVSDFNQMRFAVVDIGELTTCGNVFQGGSRIDEGFTSTDVSMGQVHKSTAAQVYSVTGLDIPHWEIRDIVRNGGQVMLPSAGGRPAKPYDITPIYNYNIANLKPVLRSVFGDYITNAGNVHYIIVGGGGSETIGTVLDGIYRQARIVGQFATVQGLRNYGERLCDAKNR